MSTVECLTPHREGGGGADIYPSHRSFADSEIQGARNVLALFNIFFLKKCNWLAYIQQQVETVTGNKPHPFANRSLGVVTLVGDDGTDAKAEALARPDDTDRLLGLQCHHVASLERLQVGMRSGLDVILQNAPHVVIERVEFGRLKRSNHLPPEVIWPTELLCQLGLSGVGIAGGCSVLLEDNWPLDRSP